jgi:hypothetical protein
LELEDGIDIEEALFEGGNTVSEDVGDTVPFSCVALLFILDDDNDDDELVSTLTAFCDDWVAWVAVH